MMSFGLCSRLLAALLVSIAIVFVTVPEPLRAADSMNARAVDDLILPLMSTYKVPGAALALIKDG